MFIELFVFLTSLVSALAQCTSCPEIGLQGAEVIYSKHCPLLLSMRDTHPYFQCLQANYDFNASSEACRAACYSSDPPYQDPASYVNYVCNPTPYRVVEVINLICCIVYQDVVPLGQNGGDAVDISRVCIIDQFRTGNLAANPYYPYHVPSLFAPSSIKG